MGGMAPGQALLVAGPIEVGVEAARAAMAALGEAIRAGGGGWRIWEVDRREELRAAMVAMDGGAPVAWCVIAGAAADGDGRRLVIDGGEPWPLEAVAGVGAGGAAVRIAIVEGG